jgi:hypothetical protein
MVVLIDYTNHRGERAIRRIIPVSIRYATSEWHTRPQWLLIAFDLDKRAHRSFALKDVHSWKDGDEVPAP